MTTAGEHIHHYTGRLRCRWRPASALHASGRGVGVGAVVVLPTAAHDERCQLVQGTFGVSAVVVGLLSSAAVPVAPLIRTPTAGASAACAADEHQSSHVTVPGDLVARRRGRPDLGCDRVGTDERCVRV